MIAGRTNAEQTLGKGTMHSIKRHNCACKGRKDGAEQRSNQGAADSEKKGSQEKLGHRRTEQIGQRHAEDQPMQKYGLQRDSFD